MGLDITAYGNCTPVDAEMDEDGEPTRGDVVRIWVNQDFPERAEGLRHRHHYAFRASMRFAAGSYDAYGRWRRELARLGGYEAEDAWEDRVGAAPFLEMVDFADNEGVIGPKTSAKLAADFAAHDQTARRTMEPEDLRLYLKWREAFEMARDGGFVRFH